MPAIIIGCQYYRNQFDDWLAGGSVQYKGKINYWSAQDSNYGFGWEIEPISEEDWTDISEPELIEIKKMLKKCLCEHKTKYLLLGCC